MTPEGIFTAGVVMIGFFAVKFSMSLPFASYQAYKFAGEQGQDDWVSQGSVSRFFRIARLVFGWGKLTKTGDVHAGLLSTARIIVQISILDLLAGLCMIGWAMARG